MTERAANAPWELVSRYDRPVPRYTSYPTVPVWREWDGEQAARALGNVAKDEPLSVYVHLPFCDRMCLYCGCNVVVSSSGGPLARYLDALERELALVYARVGARPLAQLHYGGGTPTMLSCQQLERLTNAITARFPRRDDADMSIEIDPVTTTREQLTTAARLGFNRISLGVQDFDDEVQRLIGRNQPAEVTRRVFGWAREAGFGSINLDLMYGLPGQTVDTVRASAAEAARLGADRVALFAYAHVPEMKPHQRQLEKHGLPAARQRWEMTEAAHRALDEHGYVFIGMDHFAKPEDELVLARANDTLYRNFQGYTVRRATELVGLGASSISDVGGSYFQSEKRLSAYHKAVDGGVLPATRGHARTADDELRRNVILDVMCRLAVDGRAIGERFGIDFAAHFAGALTALAPLESDGLVVRERSGFRVTELGRGFVRNIASLFDAYLARDAQVVMSRAM